MRFKNEIWLCMYVNLIGSTTKKILEQMIIREREEMEAIGLILSLSNPLRHTQQKKGRRIKNKKTDAKSEMIRQ